MSDENESKSEVRVFKHDIKNQLSNITLALEQLRYEIPELSDDCEFYIDTISKSCVRIDSLVNNL